MKTALLSTVALVISATLTDAADLPRRLPGPVAPPAYTWTGFYVGANAGFAWDRGKRCENPSFPLAPTASNGPFAIDIQQNSPTNLVEVVTGVPGDSVTVVQNGAVRNSAIVAQLADNSTAAVAQTGAGQNSAIVTQGGNGIGPTPFAAVGCDRAGALTVPNTPTVIGGPGGVSQVLTNAGFHDRQGTRSGFNVGGQIGFNYQPTPGSGVVLGVEADLQWLGSRQERPRLFGADGSGFATARPVLPAVAIFPQLPVGGGFGIAPASVVPGALGNVALFNNALSGSDLRRGHDWFGTVRGRLGYAVDRVLVYATGGVAFADRNDSRGNLAGLGFASGAAVAASPTPFFVGPAAAANALLVSPTFARSRSDTNLGWVAGWGLEYSFTDNLSLKAETLYASFAEARRGAAGGEVIGVSNTAAPITRAARDRSRDDMIIVRGGVNYRFSGM